MRPWVDIHVLLSQTTPPLMQRACLQSIKVAQASVDFPLAIHLIPSVQGHIGLMRYQGYRKGNAPYVANIDDDDLLLPHGLSILKDALEQQPDAIFPLEIEGYCYIDGNRVIETSRQPGRQRHSMKVFRREHLIDHRLWRWAGEVAQLTYLQTLPFLIDLTPASYLWRVHRTSNSLPLRLKYPDELRRARGSDIPLLSSPP